MCVNHLCTAGEERFGLTYGFRGLTLWSAGTKVDRNIMEEGYGYSTHDILEGAQEETAED